MTNVQWGKRQFSRGHLKRGREVEKGKRIQARCHSGPVRTLGHLHTASKEKQDHKEPVKESHGIVVETPLATASSQKLQLPDVRFLKEECV